MTNKSTQTSDERLLADDGKTHINIYSNGKTQLGRLLSHFTLSPFTHPFFGHFRCMEGFWFYMRSQEHLVAADQRDDTLRYLLGRAAQQYGRARRMIRYDDFKEDIMAGNYQKILQTPALRKLFLESDLPFRHHYVFKSDLENAPVKIVKPQDHEWLCKGFEDIRTAMQHDEVPDCWKNAEKRYTAAETDGPKQRR